LRVLGVDVDSKRLTGVVLEDKKVLFSFNVNSKQTDPWLTRLQQMTESFDIWKTFAERVDKVYVEEPIYVQNARSTIAVSGAFFLVITRCIDAGVPWDSIKATTWRRKIMGRGGAKKDEVERWLKANHSAPENADNHYYDAFGIALSHWFD
jgi:Holliday junction resolvasome RuvABC endonuclease subunit